MSLIKCGDSDLPADGSHPEGSVFSVSPVGTLGTFSPLVPADSSKAPDG